MGKLILYLLVAVLILAGIGALSGALLGSIPASVICLNPYYDPVIYFCAYSFLGLCLAGLLCIFIKVIRWPVAILTCVLMLSYLALACWNHAIEMISYKAARGSEAAVERPCIIEERDYSNFRLTFRFLDEEGSEPVSADAPFAFITKLNEGDTCVAVVWNGVLGINFISKAKEIKRKKNSNS